MGKFDYEVKEMKKLLVVILALVLAISAISCTANGTKKPANTTDSVTTEDNTVKPNLPDVDYDGRKYRISMNQGKSYEFYAEEDSDNPIQSALWQRNSAVEDTYNVRIKPVYNEAVGTIYSHADAILEAFFSDDDSFDVTATMVVGSGGLVLQGALVDWSSQKYTQLDGSWWLSGANDQFEIFGHIYTADGTTCISALRYTYAMMYNKTMGDSIDGGITDEIYAAIDSDEWTMDYFLELTSNVYNDTDDTPGRSANDTFGFVAENLTNLDAYSQAFGLSMLSPSETDGIVFSYPSERLYLAVDKVLALYESNGSYIYSEGGQEGNAFNHNRALFATMRVETAIGGGLEIMEDVYTILPYPMLDDEQDAYYSGVMDNYTVLGIYKLAPDYEFVSIITEAMNIEAEKTLYPAYYDEALCKKYVTDERYVEMVDIVLQGRRFDMGTLFQQNLSRVSMMFRDVVRRGENVMKEYIDGSTENINNGIESIVTSYRENVEK
jgi:hypothetical protein